MKFKRKKGTRRSENSEVTPLGHTMLEVVENQIRENEPKEVAETLARLVKLGFTRERAMHQIASVLIVETFKVMQGQEEFDEARYIYLLKQLPELPEELK